ncbi:MAG: hypothetical protein U0R17_01015 [Acidimicrobiia bacterium]
MSQDDRLEYTRSSIYPWEWMGDDDIRIPSHEDLHLFFDSILHNAQTNVFGHVEIERELSNALESLKLLFLKTFMEEADFEEMTSSTPFSFFANKNNFLLAVALLSQYESPTFLAGVPTQQISPSLVTTDTLRKLGGITKTYVFDDVSGNTHEIKYSIPENLMNFLGRSTHIFHEIFGEIPINGIVTLSEIDDLFKAQTPTMQQIAVLAYLRENVIPICHMLIQSGAIEDLPSSTCEYFLDQAVEDINREIARFSSQPEMGRHLPLEIDTLERRFVPEKPGPYSCN